MRHVRDDIGCLDTGLGVVGDRIRCSSGARVVWTRTTIGD
jgi:hypothetical protein